VRAKTIKNSRLKVQVKVQKLKKCLIKGISQEQITLN
jgi:hypothetical protein